MVLLRCDPVKFLPVTFLVSGFVWFSSRQHEPDDFEHLVRYGYGGFLVSSSMLHSFMEGSHLHVMVDGDSGCFNDDPSEHS